MTPPRAAQLTPSHTQLPAPSQPGFRGGTADRNHCVEQKPGTHKPLTSTASPSPLIDHQTHCTSQGGKRKKENALFSSALTADMGAASLSPQAEAQKQIVTTTARERCMKTMNATRMTITSTTTSDNSHCSITSCAASALLSFP